MMVKAVQKQMAVIVEAMNSHKSVGQVRFFALDVNDRQIILDGIIYDEELGCWKDVNDLMKYSQDWEEAFVQHAAKILIKYNFTCRCAFFCKHVKRKNLAIAVNLEKVKTLLEFHGYVVKSLTNLDKKKGA